MNIKYFSCFFSITLFCVTSVQAKHVNLIKEQIPYTNTETSEVSFTLALKEFNNSDVNEAKKILQKILLEDPFFYKARVQLSHISLINGDIDTATSLLKKGLELDKYNPELIKHLATIKQQEGDIQGSMDLLLNLPNEYKDNFHIKALLAYNYYQQKFYDLSLKHYTDLIQIDNRESKWWLGLAMSQDAIGQKKHALNSYSRAKNLEGLNKETLYYINARVEDLKGNNG